MSKKKWENFLCGLAIGTGIGILFAPKSGKETRKELKESLDNLIASIKNLDKEDIKDILILKINDIKTSLEELDKETVLENAKNLVNKIKIKLGELKILIVNNTTPYVEACNEKFRANTIKLLNKTITRFEE